MKRFLILALVATGVTFGATAADAACNSWGAYTGTAYKNTKCTCGSATGYSSYRPAHPTDGPGDGAARIYSGNNSTNDIQFYLRCYNDAGNRYTTVYSAWNTGSYVYKACSSSYPLATRTACKIRP